MGSVYLDMGFVSDAESAFRRATDQDPKSAQALVGLARCLERKREFATAASLYKRVTELKPTDARGWVGLARLQATGGETQKAIATLRTSLCLVPDNPRLLGELALLLIPNERSAQEAEDLARKATKLAPEIAPTHETLGDVLKELHKQGATESYRRAFELYSANQQQTASAQRVKAKLESLTEER
jgi:Flp pilus assembly protein TadD